MRYAIQLITNGTLIDYCDTREQAEGMLNTGNFELVDTNNATKISVVYTELYSADYGHQEESFTTYGPLTLCISRLYNWAKRTAKVFGPDYKDIQDYFKKCNLYVNGVDRTSWFEKITKIEKGAIIV